MIDKYWVAKRPGNNEDHAVHKEDCPFLPDNDKRIYLGEFCSGADAVREGQRYFGNTNGCIFCSKEHNVQKGDHFRFKWLEPDVVEQQAPIPYEESMICCVN
jgi:hypothetical protein